MGRMIENIKWLGHASVLIEKEGKFIYVDPWKIKREEKGDLILITHSHFDHCSPDDIEKVKKDETVIIGPSDAVAKVKGMRTIGLTGKDGGQLSPMVEIAIKAPASATNRVQEQHQLIYHTLCSLVEAHYFQEKK